jgi:hypothetical protein
VKRAIVIDASVAWKWFDDLESHQHLALELIGEDNAVYAPDLIGPELLNILWKRTRRGDLPRDLANDIFAAIEGARMQIRSSTPLMRDAWEYAIALDHSIYDCVYLALAGALGCKLVTADRKFYSKVIATELASGIHWIEDPL